MKTRFRARGHFRVIEKVSQETVSKPERYDPIQEIIGELIVTQKQGRVIFGLFCLVYIATVVFGFAVIKGWVK